MRIWYGIKTNRREVTRMVQSLLKYGVLFVSEGDAARTELFRMDPMVGTLKSVFITDLQIDNEIVLSPSQSAYIDWDNNKVFRIGLDQLPIDIRFPIASEQKLSRIHAQLRFSHGSLQDEYPEQLIAASFLRGPETVLEIGGNIGRNSLVIASSLHDPTRLLTLECDPISSAALTENRDQNPFPFRIECAALSKRPLFQKGWQTSDVGDPAEGWTPIKTVTYTELVSSYNLRFDTLVLDCEGAFYFIVQDMPEVLTNIRMVIMENDYSDLRYYTYVANALTEHGLKCVYSKSLGNDSMVCASNFYEVWTV